MARIAAILVALVTGALLIFIVLSHFVTGVMADRRIEVNRDVLTAMAKFFPNSSRVYTRLAEAEMSEIADYERDTASAEEHALRAIRLSPWDYNLRLLLASAREARGDREAAEDALHQALKLAPNYTEVHWSLANMLLRTGRFKESLDEFRVAVADNLAVLPAALKLVWNTSNGEVEATSAITSGEPPARLVLAQFLLTHARVAEAAQVFSQIERNARLDSPHSARFLDTLITTDHVGLARNLWVDLMTGETSASHPLIWNGSFEFDIAKGLAQFDWTLGRSEYARLTIDTSLARTGARSLKIYFAGRDTTRTVRPSTFRSCSTATVSGQSLSAICSESYYKSGEIILSTPQRASRAPG